MATIKYSPAPFKITLEAILENPPTPTVFDDETFVLGGAPADKFRVTVEGDDFTYSNFRPTGGEIDKISIAFKGDDGFQNVQVISKLDIDLGELTANVLTGNAKGALDLVFGQDDKATGSRGADLIFTGGGDDFISGGLGDDRIEGGAGVDTVSYAYAKTSAFVNLAKQDGATDRAVDDDKLISIENVIGTRFADKLLGSSADNEITGGKGADFIAGGKGDDTFHFVKIGRSAQADNIQDFDKAGFGDDQLAFNARAFKIGADGFDLVQGAGPQQAEEARATFLFDTSKGVKMLSFDVDGTGGKAAVDIATLKGVGSLQLDDFLII